MKVLVQDGLGANHFIRLGIANAFGILGHSVYLWNDNKSAHDAFSEFEPDLFIGSTYQLTRAIEKCIISRKNIKITLYAPNWGESDSLVPPNYPLLFASEEEKKRVENLQKAGRLQWIFGQYPQDELVLTHGKWEGLGVKVFSLVPALDTAEFRLTLPNKEYVRDIFFCGGYWPYKSAALQKYLLSLCYPNTNLKIGVYGNGWGAPQALGPISNSLMSAMIPSSKVCLNLFEPHSTNPSIPFSDINQRSFQIPGCGGFTLSQKANGLEKIFPNNEIVTFDDSDYAEKLDKYLNNPFERLDYIVQSCKTVYSRHTFIHRVFDILDHLEDFNSTAIALAKADEMYGFILHNLEIFTKKWKEIHG